jgi:perosamine synthetase
MIHILNAYIHPDAKKMVGEVLDSTLIVPGKRVEQFEAELAQSLGLVNPVVVNSGSTALEMALELLGMKDGDEVISPPQTFVATALAALKRRAVPVFADIQYETGNISPESIREKITAKTKVIMPVHWGGVPCDMDEIVNIAKENNLYVVEDAAHALGSTYKGRWIGSIADISCFSFQALKHVTTGDGGAVCCLDDALTDQAFKKRWFGIERRNPQKSILGEVEYDLKDWGFKYNLNDFSASLGLANIQNIHERLKWRREIEARYRKAFFNVPGITLFEKRDDRESACWLFGMHVEKRVEFIKAMRARDIEVSINHGRIDRNSCFGGIRKDLEGQARFEKTQIHIPMHDALSEEDVETVIAAVKAGW